jgi:hypothetical protein
VTLPDIDALATYGGALNNYAPVEDPSTDEDAGYRNKYATNVAAATHTVCRAWCAFVGKASSPPDDPSSNVHDSVWGNLLGVKPTVARTGPGVYTITWPTSVNDELGVAHTVNLRRCWPPNIEGATPYEATATVTSPNVVTVRTFTVGTSTPNDAVGATITVFVV